MDVPNGFLELVESRMRHEGLSLRAVAKEAGLSPSFLSRILNGERGLPPNEILLKLAKALRIDPPALLLVQAERIPTRSLGPLAEDETKQVLRAIAMLVKGHQRRSKRTRP